MLQIFKFSAFIILANPHMLFGKFAILDDPTYILDSALFTDTGSTSFVVCKFFINLLQMGLRENGLVSDSDIIPSYS